MAQDEFSTKMVALEAAINALTAYLESERDETSFRTLDGDVDVERHLEAHEIVRLAETLTTTKLAISYLHRLLYN